MRGRGRSSDETVRGLEVVVYAGLRDHGVVGETTGPVWAWESAGGNSNARGTTPAEGPAREPEPPLWSRAKLELDAGEPRRGGSWEKQVPQRGRAALGWPVSPWDPQRPWESVSRKLSVPWVSYPGSCSYGWCGFL